MSVAEYQLLNIVLNNRDYSVLTDNLIDGSYFSQAKDEYKYLESYYTTYASVPDKESFIAKFPDWKFIDVGEQVRAVVDSIREATTFVKACDLFDKASEIFKEDSIKGVEYMQNVMVKELQPSYSFTYTDITKDSRRYQEWQEKLENKEEYFIPSGFDSLDEYTYGWKREEEFALIMARTGVGELSPS